MTAEFKYINNIDLSNIKITNIENDSFTKKEEDFLANIFLITIDRLIPCLASEAWFRIEDFINIDAEDHIKAIKEQRLRMLIMRRNSYNSQKWHGTITGDNKRFIITAITSN